MDVTLYTDNVYRLIQYADRYRPVWEMANGNGGWFWVMRPSSEWLNRHSLAVADALHFNWRQQEVTRAAA